MDNNLEIIKKHFPNLEEGVCEEIAQVSSRIHLSKEESLISENKYIKTFPMVFSGLLKIYRTEEEGRETFLYYLQPGQICSVALACCMENVKSNINITAIEDTELIRIPIKYIDDWLVKYPSWKHLVMRSYKQRFDELLHTIDNLAFKKMDERILDFFLDYHKTTGKKVYKGTHEEIARTLTTSRESISRLLKIVEKDGKITLGRNKIDFSKLIVNS
ncbi:MAG: Crp/Fnr family transcriptional regulator [Flavobacteriales bacterium]|nr:Crp/Fnr family transcriptional regulator [Flavobacteriales bacterium]